MLVTLFGIVTLDRLVHCSNAEFPMLVTLLGIVMLARLVQPWNAASPILVTLLSFAKVTEVTVVSASTQFSGISPVFVVPT